MIKPASNAPEIKGWCPGALRPMMSGDGLVVRVRPRGGRLSPDQARGIAALSRQFGNGLIDLSTRANVQLRGVTEAGHGPLIEGLRNLGLIDPSTEAEARRNVAVTPFWCEGDGIADLARRLTEALAAEDAPQTPGKFGYAVDCGSIPVLRATSADIRIERGAAGLILRADGADHGALVTAETAAPMALRLARWFLESGGVPEGRGRMAAHLKRGAALPPEFAGVPCQFNAAPAPAPGSVSQGILVGIEFGQMQAETLSILAEMGALRITPWRMILIEGASSIARELPGMITRPDDPMLRVVACTGAPGCPQAFAPTRPLARALCAKLPPDQSLHISGCAKGCAHPGPAPLTLVARPNGRFDLVRAGIAADMPSLTDLSAERLTQFPALLTE